MEVHKFRELVNDLCGISKQYHTHDSLRDRISSRMSEDIQPDYPAPANQRPQGSQPVTTRPASAGHY